MSHKPCSDSTSRSLDDSYLRSFTWMVSLISANLKPSTLNKGDKSTGSSINLVQCEFGAAIFLIFTQNHATRELLLYPISNRLLAASVRQPLVNFLSANFGKFVRGKQDSEILQSTVDPKNSVAFPSWCGKSLHRRQQLRKLASFSK